MAFTTEEKCHINVLNKILKDYKRSSTPVVPGRRSPAKKHMNQTHQQSNMTGALTGMPKSSRRKATPKRDKEIVQKNKNKGGNLASNIISSFRQKNHQPSVFDQWQTINANPLESSQDDFNKYQEQRANSVAPGSPAKSQTISAQPSVHSIDPLSHLGDNTIINLAVERQDSSNVSSNFKK